LATLFFLLQQELNGPDLPYGGGEIPAIHHALHFKTLFERYLVDILMNI
jgi:hypothetical protein